MNTAFTILFYDTVHNEIVSKLLLHSDLQNCMYSCPCVRNAGKMGVTSFVLEETCVEKFSDFEKFGVTNSAWFPGFLVKSNEEEPVEANALVTFCMLHENGSKGGLCRYPNTPCA